MNARTASRQPGKVTSDLIRILLRHKKKSLIFFSVVIAATVAAIFVLPRTYRSESKLFVRVGRESVALDPTATTGQTVGLTDSRETEINSLLEILRSRGLAEKVVDELGAAFVLGKSSSASDATANEVALKDRVIGLFTGADTVTPYERAVTKLQRTIDASAQKRTTVIDVACTADSPAKARTLVKSLLDVFAQEHARINHTAGSLKFFTQQTAVLDKDLADANQELRAAKNDSELASIEGQRTMLQHEMTTVESELNSSENALAAAQARMATINGSLAKIPERVDTEAVRGIPNSASDDMRKQLYELELREMEARSRYSDEHPTVIALGRQLAAARAVVQSQEKTRTQLTETIHPARLPLSTSLITEEAEAAAAAAKIKVLTKQRETVLAKLKALNGHELKISQIQRRVDQLDQAHRSYLEKREQSRIDGALAQDRISNVNVVQAPSLVSKPVSPNKLLTLGLGLVLAIGGALGLAFVAEYFDQSLKSAGEVESALDTSVLVSIPRMARHRVILN